MNGAALDNWPETQATKAQATIRKEERQVPVCLELSDYRANGLFNLHQHSVHS
jgi:hypothetical protein